MDKKTQIEISGVQFVSAQLLDVDDGFLGWVSCTLNESIRLNGLALRRTREGRLALSFPARKDAMGRKHFFLRPLDDATRRKIERQVFRALGLETSKTQ